jgi:Lantibiotic biosynthesis dehydratase C-term
MTQTKPYYYAFEVEFELEYLFSFFANFLDAFDESEEEIGLKPFFFINSYKENSDISVIKIRFTDNEPINETTQNEFQNILQGALADFECNTDLRIATYKAEPERYGEDQSNANELFMSSSVNAIATFMKFLEDEELSAEEDAEEDEDEDAMMRLESSLFTGAIMYTFQTLAVSGLSVDDQNAILLADIRRWLPFEFEEKQSDSKLADHFDMRMAETIQTSDESDAEFTETIKELIPELADAGESEKESLLQFRQAIASGEIVRTEAYLVKSLPQDWSYEKKAYASFILDLLHLHRNRLTIFNDQEADYALQIYKIFLGVNGR